MRKKRPLKLFGVVAVHGHLVLTSSVNTSCERIRIHEKYTISLPTQAPEAQQRRQPDGFMAAVFIYSHA
jgi:hypothetical protein